MIDNKSQKRHGRISIAAGLAAAIGLLVLISVGAVLVIGAWLAQKNTFSLLSTNADISINASINRIKQHLKPSENQAQFIARRIANGDIDPSDKKSFAVFLAGALAATPQIDAVIYFDTQLRSFSVGQNRSTEQTVQNSADHSQDLLIRRNMKRAATGKFWGPPIWREQYKSTYLNFTYPVKREGKLVGAIVSVVSVQKLSHFVGDGKLVQAGQRFILYGRDHVLAHPFLVNGARVQSDEHPLPRLDMVHDKILSAIWQQHGKYKVRLSLSGGTRGHSLDIGGQRYVFIYRELYEFGDKPLIVGAYFLASSIGEEVSRMKLALAIGLGALMLSLLAAIVVGRQIAKPITRISRASSRIGSLDISKIDKLSGSVFRELDDQSIAFNSMLAALRWFELYVPKKIVDILIQRGGIEDVVSDSKNITIMFTDIAGFTSAAENMRAPQVADLLNRHFALVAKSIADEDGIVDKFIGDAVMAFWGALQPQDDHAERACRAARAIAAALHEDNKTLRRQGKPPIHMRIGIHTGPATVGNIGSPDRLNYTVIGDTVNVGQRLEQLGKQLLPADAEVTILVSGTTRAELGDDFRPISHGVHKVKGHAEPIDVFQLKVE